MAAPNTTSQKTISIHALLAESDYFGWVCGILWLISIHALLAESDSLQAIVYAHSRYFYPRSPCGERLPPPPGRKADDEFLSTLSLRRATLHAVDKLRLLVISIHALLAESDT